MKEQIWIIFKYYLTRNLKPTLEVNATFHTIINKIKEQ